RSTRMQERMPKEPRRLPCFGHHAPRHRIAARDVAQVVVDRDGVEIDVRERVVPKLQPRPHPPPQQPYLGWIRNAVTTELAFVDEPNGRHMMRLQRTNQLLR